MRHQTASRDPRPRHGDANKLSAEDRPVHDWYRFVLSFPPHLVRDCLRRFSVTSDQRVLDPFCGTGTTLVECKKLGIPSVGVEANRMAHFASRVKVDWTPNPDELEVHAERVTATARSVLEREGVPDEPPFAPDSHATVPPRRLGDQARDLILKDSISPFPLHKALVLLDCLERHRDPRYSDHERLAFARALVFSASNLQFGPEVGVGPAKPNSPLVTPWRSGVRAMAGHLRSVRSRKEVPAEAHLADARRILQVLEPGSVDAVITSPPYPNEKDYTRTTRLESVLLGFIRDKADLRAMKQHLVRSNTRNVYKGDDDDRLVSEHPEIQRIADAIERRRLDLGKTSGFERLYPRVMRLYFGGMARHLADLRTILRPGAHLAYVVGDQASYLRVMIRTGQLLADLGQALGYEKVGIDLFRTRLATATREQLREEVVILRWPG